MFTTQIKKYSLLVIGITIVCLGIAFAIISEIGVAPIGSLPNALSFTLPITTGQLTIALNIIFVLLQKYLLKSDFKAIQWLQILISFFMGILIDSFVNVLIFLKSHNYVLNLLFALIGIILLGLGLAIELAAKVDLMIPADGLVRAISATKKIAFSKVKIGFDLSLMILALLATLIFNHQLLGIREGTLLSALLTGLCVKYFQALGRYYQTNSHT
ncbi:DUF6198 family protein [Streptococcus didelphis]|uniref:DUF6198 family protein n=1 Tax=Streptococcus didelphis TaxID=102886 RepID=A0ABY9LG21_9STRE|nr:DUF6198 family protein [Streptococcus didelphis]WMB27805.1 DUF6198 family protein [Streptococcus didelphis]WMB29730.1 DUF6198 family protein [Streptococcus didelphis]